MKLQLAAAEAARPALIDALHEMVLIESGSGDVEGLLTWVSADHVAVRMGGLAEIRGAAAVAETFKGRAQAAKPALIDGAVGLAVILGGQLRIALNLTNHRRQDRQDRGGRRPGTAEPDGPSGA